MSINDKIALSKKITLLAGVFCMIIAGLLLLNYWQVSGTDPVESKVLEALIARLRSEPGNTELITEIRNFDLLARKAYFTSQWQIKTGAYLLLGGAFVLIAALVVYYNLNSRIEEPDKDHESEISGRLLAQKWLIAAGLIIFGLAYIASLSSVNHLSRYQPPELAAEAQDHSSGENIELIEVGTISEPEPVDDNYPLVTENPDSHPVPEQPDDVDEQTAELPAEASVNIEKATLSIGEMKENHNSFRGPLGQGVVYHKNIPVSWDGASGSNIRWKVPVPKHGYNSPVVWGSRVFVSGADERSREVYCFDASDGSLLWTGKADGIPGSPVSPPRVTEDTGLSASTVASDGKSVYAIFATGDVVAFDMTGNRVWARNLGTPDNHYGHSSSLIVWSNNLFVQFDTNKGGRIMALDTSTGETRWETQRNAKISWASPVLAQVDNDYQVLLSADPIVAGYDVLTGKELWSVECMMGEVGPSVAFFDNVVYAANEYARLVAVNVKTQEILWENDMYLPEASSPLAYEGLLIIATSYGVLVCYDAKTGEQYWEHDVGRTLYSSPVYADGKLYMMDNDGVMRVYEYGRELKLLHENGLGESAGTTPAFAEGKIYIRGEEHLFCIGNE